eukprot:444192-Amphidinium_carterae.1
MVEAVAEMMMEVEIILENRIVHGADTPEMRINRDGMKLPKLKVIKQHFTVISATMQQKILNW